MVLLPWTPPYDWAWMVGFLQARAVAGVERFHDGGYSRSFGVEGHRGLIHLAPDEEAQGLRVTLSPGCSRWRRFAMRELASCLI